MKDREPQVAEATQRKKRKEKKWKKKKKKKDKKKKVKYSGKELVVKVQRKDCKLSYSEEERG